MAPEREISSSQFEEVEKWLRNNAAGVIAPGVYVVKGEPLVLRAFAMHGPDQASVNSSKIYRLTCSNNHAQELEETGIILVEAETTQESR